MDYLMYANQKFLYDLLFKCSSDTILTLCRDPKYMGATPGIASVLHSRGQQLSLHPHLHVMVSGGGLNHCAQFRETKHKGFIIPVRTIGRMFRRKYLTTLKKLYKSGQPRFDNRYLTLRNRFSFQKFINQLFKKKWLPSARETFNGNGNAVKYLARYADRPAINNSRIVAMDKDTVSFRYTDYTDHNQKKVKAVSDTEFIRLFLMHILPREFNRIRFSDFLTNCTKTKNLKQIHQLRNTIYNGNLVKDLNTAELMLLLFGHDICHCSKCSGQLIRLPRGVPLKALQV